MLLRNATLSFLLVSLTLLGSLYFLGVPDGAGPVVAISQGLAVALLLLVFAVYRVTYIGVTDGRLVERGFLGGARVVPVSAVASIILAETYRVHAPDSTPQLLMRDADNRRLLRMRGVFWTVGDMTAVAEAIGVEISRFQEPTTSKEFFARYPGSAYWFEDRPVIVIAVIAAVAVLSLGLVLGLMHLFGIPVSALV